MCLLGYDKFVAHGGERREEITHDPRRQVTEARSRHPHNVREAPLGFSADGLTQAEPTWVQKTRDSKRDHIANAKQRATRPQTIWYSLVDSPLGLLAWILDKFAEWSDTHDSPFETMSKDRILDIVSLYWLTRCGTSSARNYYESHNSPDPELRVDVHRQSLCIPTTPRRLRAPGRRSGTDSSFNGGPRRSLLAIPEYFVRDLHEGLVATLLPSDKHHVDPAGPPTRPNRSDQARL